MRGRAITSRYRTLLTAVLVAFGTPCLAQTIVPTSSTPVARYAMGIGDQVLYDSEDPAYATTTYTANPIGLATLELQIEGAGQVWSVALVSGHTIAWTHIEYGGASSLTIPLDAGTYDVTLLNFASSDVGDLVHKSIQVQDVTFDTLRVSDAVNTYRVEVRDELGNTETNPMWRGYIMYHEPSNYWLHLVTDGGESAHDLRHNNVPADYGFDIELISHPNLTKRYRVGFRKYVYSVPVTDPTEPNVILAQALGGPGFESILPTAGDLLHPPYRVETYIQRQPDSSFPHPADATPPYRFSAFEQPMEVEGPPGDIEIVHLHSGIPSVVHRSDGTLHLGYSSSYQMPSVELTTEEIPLGLAPVHYFGRIGANGFENATPTYYFLVGHDFQPALPVFPMQANDADINDVPYTLYDENGAVISIGMATDLFSGWPAGGPAPWELVLTHDQTSIGETPSVATARLFFDLDRSDPNPPALGYLTIRQEGELTDTVTEPEVAHVNFSIVDSSAVPVIELDYRLHGTSNWTALPFSPDGDGYEAPMPLDLAEDVLYDLRFTLEDDQTNRLEFTVEPAFSTSTVIVSADPDATPEPLSLSAPYPNPTQDISTISYTLPQAGHVRLIVYDLLGREITVPVDGARQAGVHEVNLDVSALPSGIYSVQLHTGNGQTSRRFSVIH